MSITGRVLTPSFLDAFSKRSTKHLISKSDDRSNDSDNKRENRTSLREKSAQQLRAHLNVALRCNIYGKRKYQKGRLIRSPRSISVRPRNDLDPQKLLNARTSIEATPAALLGPTVRETGFVVDGHVVDVYSAVDVSFQIPYFVI